MRNNIIATTALLISFAWNITAQSINTEASQVTFDVTNMKVRTVEGSIGGMSGTLTFDKVNLNICEFDVCIDATTINTGNTKRDDHLQEDDFFDTANHPQICFISEMVKPSNNGYAVVGQLTLKGVVKTVMIPFTFDGSTFNGNLALSRADFSIGEDTNNFLVGDLVNIQINCNIN